LEGSKNVTDIKLLEGAPASETPGREIGSFNLEYTTAVTTAGYTHATFPKVFFSAVAEEPAFCAVSAERSWLVESVASILINKIGDGMQGISARLLTLSVTAPPISASQHASLSLFCMVHATSSPGSGSLKYNLVLSNCWGVVDISMMSHSN
jgi:hypothetical protein